MRTHVVLPEALVEEVDKLVGQRRRSAFFADAIQRKLKQLKLKSAAKHAAGSLSDAPTEGWESSEKAAEWVHASRRLVGKQNTKK